MSSTLLHFPRWAEVLRDSAIPEEIKKSREITLRWYLSWCRKRGIGCSVNSAHAFVEWARKEKNANEWLIEQWKASIRWYFIEGKRQAESMDADRLAGQTIQGLSLVPEPEAELDRSDYGEELLSAFSTDEERILDLMRRRGMALRTERSYIRWYRDFLRHSKLSSATQINAAGLKSYLSYLAMDRAVSSSTQKIALNALVFVVREVFELEIGEVGDFCRAKTRKRIPVVMSKAETRRVFEQLNGNKLLMAKLQYAGGLRVSELVRLRIKDLDLERNQIIVRSGKGNKDRVAPFSERLIGDLEKHLIGVRQLFESDFSIEPGLCIGTVRTSAICWE